LPEDIFFTHPYIIGNQHIAHMDFERFFIMGDTDGNKVS